MKAKIKDKILVAGNNPTHVEELCRQIRLREEFMVVGTTGGQNAIDAATKERFSAILIDVNLYDIDGREACKLLRWRAVNVPLILLADSESDADEILAFDMGANDYLTRPLRIGTLIARLRTHIRLHERSEDASLIVGPYVYSPPEKTLVHKGEGIKITLTMMENAIMRFLYRAENRVVDPETLYSEVWGHSDDTLIHTLQTHVYRLRRKIETIPSDPKILITDHRGYRLVR